MELHPYLPQPELLKFSASKGESLSYVSVLDILTGFEGSQAIVINGHQHQLPTDLISLPLWCLNLKLCSH